MYERDGQGRVTQILGVQGKQLAASIQLSYDQTGRLKTATGQRETGATVSEKDKVTVNYEYDAAGMLTAVSSNEGRTGYQYEGSHLIAITYREPQQNGKKIEDKVVRRFEYNPHGQMLAEMDASGAKTEYRVTADDQGKTLSVASAGGKAAAETIQYDSAFRPVQAQYANGIKARWQYPEAGGSALVLASPEGKKITLTESADQRQKTLQLDPQRKLAGEYDSLGRLTSLTDNGLPLLRQEWDSNGRLRLAANQGTAIHPEYDAEGLVSSIVLAPSDEPNKKGEFKHFQETKLDAAGRPLAITDNSGLQVQIGYDRSGQLKSMINKREGQNFGFQVTRDDLGRIKGVDSSWGKQTYAYDTAGLVNNMVVETQGSQASVALKDGLVQKVKQFDGGEYTIDYYPNGTNANRPKQITTPNGLPLQYNYTKAGQIEEVKLGKASRLKLAYDKEGRVAGWSYAPAN